MYGNTVVVILGTNQVSLFTFDQQEIKIGKQDFVWKAKEISSRQEIQCLASRFLFHYKVIKNVCYFNRSKIAISNTDVENRS